ncbi:response regulator transcription factor [Paenibacillus radicis (ex Xue et al. 2023)]|uniref:Response regulator n=1 Tax=Paenibacillus radicis (ex Xue et al. 2023) TaxID=2972489 RepID=A0ABT1YLX1_9BACL|nr:response regulator [Paenibacillus radicis (ex Xue et al. 2023)]MCR8634172.1 response regulator [Paenibacillus radicis (ex Xue et al. 2023)]
MYKVLLVDDERIILEGISNVVNWAKAGTKLIGTARNGIEAYDKVQLDPPDIIISDIKMPGMDGLQLAAKIAENYPNIKMVLLSGFGEFEYARSAIRYGVKQYLLKPCNENKIVEVLQELVKELGQEEQREQFVDNMRYGLEKILPHVKEQFLKEFVTNKTYGKRDWEYYRNLFKMDLENRKVRLILFQLEGYFEFEHMFAVKNIAEDLLKKMVLSSTVGEQVLIVVEDTEPVSELLDCISLIRETFFRYYKIDLTIALSEADDITRARVLYKQTLECLNYRFYLGEGSLITKRDIVGVEQPEIGELVFDEDNLMLQIKTGYWEEASQEIDLFFQKVAGLRSNIPTAKSYVIQLYMAMIRLGDSDSIHHYMDKLVALMDLETLQAIQSFFKEVAHQITVSHYEQTRNKHSAIVNKVVDIINEHLGNPELSLNGVAQQILYMNPDYLGKLFKKETGEKFSNYVMKARINKATELIGQKSDIKIFELAEQLGFGDNPQYFSQVFKKYTGCTPSEFMKSN